MTLDCSVSRRRFGRGAALGAVLAATLLMTPAAHAQGDAPSLDVHFVPTPMEVVDAMLDMAALKPGEYLIDLGSGDGRIPIAAVKRGATALGVDLDPRRIKEALEGAAKAGVEDKVQFRMQNLFETDLGKADVISMYLLTSINAKLRPKLLELRPGTRIVSHAFNMGDWKPDQHQRIEGRNAYMWTVPARIDGNWQLDSGGRKFPIRIDQQFQFFGGVADLAGSKVEIRDGRLTGRAITFTLDIDGKAQTFTGDVNNGAMVGTGPDANKWNAARSPS